ncbi:MAG: PLDc N-terminal domain-containing protein [Desulfovibrio sp.]|nr:PLDc N-terminal domain-containing protein [Desulfovibrio sp.]
MALKLILLVIIHLIALVFACQALLTKKDPRSALGWTMVLIFLPVIGLIIYLIFGIGRSQSHAEKIMRKISGLERHFAINKTCNDRSDLGSPEANLLAATAEKLSGAPLCGGNSLEALHDGDAAYPAMLEAIEKARQRVFLATYIFNYGVVAKKFIKALTDAKDRGVDVRVLVDGIGALYSWRKPWKILRENGVKTVRFRPPSLIPPRLGINLRSHRKLLVCDETGFTGGMNIADNDVLSLDPDKKNHIQDVQFRCEGPIVNQLIRAFLINWGFCSGEITNLPALRTPDAGSCHCRVIVDGPGKDGDALLDVLCDAINLSRKTIRIMTPYFLPPAPLTEALRSAGQRGVDTRIVLPAKNNLAYMNWAMERIIPDLLKAGARVFYQRPPFAHTKLMTMDGFYTLLGSANMDSRSLLLNFELEMEVYDSKFHDQVSKFINASINNGEELTLSYFRNLSLPAKLRNSASWIFSPYF